MTRRDNCPICHNYVGDDEPTCSSCGESYCYNCLGEKHIATVKYHHMIKCREEYERLEYNCPNYEYKHLEYERFELKWQMFAFGQDIGYESYDYDDSFEEFTCNSCIEVEKIDCERNKELEKLKTEIKMLKAIIKDQK